MFLLLAPGSSQEASGSLPTYFLPCLSKKSLLWHSLEVLVMAFPPFLSRKRLCQVSPSPKALCGPKGTLTHSCFTMSKERLPQVSPNASEVPLRGTSAEAATSKGAFSPRHFGSNVPQPRSEHDARQPHSNPPYLLRSNLATDIAASTALL